MEKKKHKMKDKVQSKWTASDIQEDSFFDGNAVTGFLGLEELHEYDENDLKDIIWRPTKKRRRTKSKAENVDEEADKLDADEKQVVDDGEQQDKAEKTEEKINSINETNKKSLKKQKNRLRLQEKRKRKMKEKKKKKLENDLKDENNIVCNENKSAEEKSNDSISRDMSNWNGLGIPNEIIKALANNNFASPTPIQKEAIPPAILYHQDIVGAAETGSGKTLAFAIPILKHIMDLKNVDSAEMINGFYALILTPTRELAMQIRNHIENVSKYTGLKSVSIVGGLSTAKQERLLSRNPEIVIGTPGRLHKFLEEGNAHLSKLHTLKYFVIDECDRMLEHGYFKELSYIIDMVNSSAHHKIQKFIFSATLTLPSNHKKFRKNNKNINELQSLVNKVNLNSKAKVINLTTKQVTAAQLTQQKVVCTSEEKDIYLSYFLISHPGRSIIFVNSISCLRRLFSLLKLLKFNPFPLHAGKQQRQRLKSLDRFMVDENGLLIATDVAARGLDIPKVKYVIHYQLPSDPKVYIHRSGRTARGEEGGLSFILEGPEDFKNYKKISQMLKLGGEDIPILPADSGYLDGIKTRITLAREIDKIENNTRRNNSFNTWLEKSAKSLDIDVEISKKEKLSKKEVSILKFKHKELDKLLSIKLLPKEFSGAYPTRSGFIVTPGINLT